MFNNSKILFPILLLIFAGVVFFGYDYTKHQPERDAQAKYEYEHSTEYVNKHNQEQLDRLHKSIDSIDKANQPTLDSLQLKVDLAKINAGVK